MATFHPTLPRGTRVATDAERRRSRRSSSGPARENDGTFNLIGGLRTSMATCGYQDLAEFNRAELMVAPALQTEGKQLQRDQGVGMGSSGKAPRSSMTDGCGRDRADRRSDDRQAREPRRRAACGRRDGATRSWCSTTAVSTRS